MDSTQVYILISLVVLGVIAVLLVWRVRQEHETRLSPLTALAFGLVVAGIAFGENRFIGYGLMAAAVILAVVDMLRQLRSG